MLEIEGLSFRYEKNSPLIFEDLSLTVENGRTGIILGGSGSGKTTLFKLILGTETPQKGTVLFGGKNLKKLSPSEKARAVAFVPHYIDFGTMTVFDFVLMGRIAFFGFRPKKKDREAAQRILEEMDLAELADRSAESLSGGEKQKVAIARALVQDPQFLVFDELTENLDAANGALLIYEIKRLADSKNIGILASVRDIRSAISFGDDFFVLKDKKALKVPKEELMQTITGQRESAAP